MTDQQAGESKSVCLKCGAEQTRVCRSCWLCGAVLGTMHAKVSLVDKPVVEKMGLLITLSAFAFFTVSLFIAFFQICLGG